jgi:predicted transcriptional regulator
MRAGIAEVLDNSSLEFAELLQSLGVQRRVARLLSYLAIAGESTSRDIECGTGLRQPEVSIAMRTLRADNWVTEHDVKSTEGKGRPQKVYTLITPIDEIIRIIEEERRKEATKAMERIQKLKDLASI